MTNRWRLTAVTLGVTWGLITAMIIPNEQVPWRYGGRAISMDYKVTIDYNK